MIAGVLLVVIVLLLVKNNASSKTENLLPTSSLPAETQLDQYLEEGKAVFVFFHSNNCASCIDMMNRVNSVYPEFKDSVPMVDVNVYDAANQNLLSRAGITTIPTQLFIDASGQGVIAMGGMTVDQLREQLMVLAEENK